MLMSKKSKSVVLSALTLVMIAVLLFTMSGIEAYAADDNPSGTTIDVFPVTSGDINMAANYGTIKDLVGGHVGTNAGTIEKISNTGSLGVNTGTVVFNGMGNVITRNEGTITTNSGTVEENYGKISVNTGTVTMRKNTSEKSEITTNKGTVYFTDKVNPGETIPADGKIGTNEGKILISSGTATIESNTGNIEITNATVTINSNAGTITLGDNATLTCTTNETGGDILIAADTVVYNPAHTANNGKITKVNPNNLYEIKFSNDGGLGYVIFCSVEYLGKYYTSANSDLILFALPSYYTCKSQEANIIDESSTYWNDVNGSLRDGFTAWSIIARSSSEDKVYTISCEEQPHTHGTGDDAVSFTAWTATDSLPSSTGSYYLREDVTLQDQWNVPVGTTNLCLNGHVIRINDVAQESGTKDESLIMIGPSCTLNLYDCNTSVEHYFNDNDGLWQNTSSKSADSVTVIGGVITGATRALGCVSVQGSFNMYSGTIAGNTSYISEDNGGGVSVVSGGSFNIHGGSIVGNRAKKGAGVYLNSGATLTMNGGTISRNKATNYGGGVWAGEGSGVNVGGQAYVNGNKASTDSGINSNIHLQNNKKNIIKISDQTPLTTNSNIGVTLWIDDDANKDKWTPGAEVGSYFDGTLTDDTCGFISFTNSGSIGTDKVYSVAKVNNQYVLSASFNVINYTSEEGKATAERNQYRSGETVKLTVTPENYYELGKDETTGKSLIMAYYDDTDYINHTLELTQDQSNPNEYKFTMPMADVNIYADFVKKYSVVKTKPSAKTDLVYTGSEQELIIAGAADNGTMYYALGEDSIHKPAEGWQTAIPKGIDAGEYFVWYKSVGDDGYFDSEVSSYDRELITIEKAQSSDISVELKGVKASVYGAKDGKITGTTTAMEYSKDANFRSVTDCMAIETTGLKAGTYYVRLKETANFYASAGKTVVIEDGDYAYNPTPIIIILPTEPATTEDTIDESTATDSMAKTVIVPYLKLSKTIGLGNKFALNVTNIFDDANVEFTSSNQKVATVDANGVITAKATGKCTVKGIIKQGRTTYKFIIAVTVRNTNKGNRQLKDSECLTPNSLTPLLNVYKALGINKSMTLNIKRLADNAVLTFSSEDESIATVSDKGVVTGVKKGLTGINIYIKQDGYNAQYRVVVKVK